MKLHKVARFVGVVLAVVIAAVGLAAPAPTPVYAQACTAEAYKQAYREIGWLCGLTNAANNTVCLGKRTVSFTFANQLVLSQAGQSADVFSLSRVKTTGGLAALKVRDSAGRSAVILAYGNTSVISGSGVGSYGYGMTPGTTCEFLKSGMLIETPRSGASAVTINDVTITLASRALVLMLPNGIMRVGNLSGNVTVTATSGTVALTPGQYVDITFVGGVPNNPQVPTTASGTFTPQELANDIAYHPQELSAMLAAELDNQNILTDQFQVGALGTPNDVNSWILPINPASTYQINLMCAPVSGIGQVPAPDITLARASQQAPCAPDSINFVRVNIFDSQRKLVYTQSLDFGGTPTTLDIRLSAGERNLNTNYLITVEAPGSASGRYLINGVGTVIPRVN